MKNHTWLFKKYYRAALIKYFLTRDFTEKSGFLLKISIFCPFSPWCPPACRAAAQTGG
jgi:hypothetical protein